MTALQWKPGDDLIVRLVDKTGSRGRNRDERVIAAILAAVEPLGFTVRQSGTDRGFALWYHQTTNPDGSMKTP